jgi:hypothetical protein
MSRVLEETGQPSLAGWAFGGWLNRITAAITRQFLGERRRGGELAEKN